MSSHQTGSSDPEIVDIDPNGDLILEVTTPASRHMLRVSSKALCLASPVFRAMLGPTSRFQEGNALQENKTGSPVRITLNDDDYSSLLIIMDVVHFRVGKVPTELTVDALYQLAVVCDKYHLAEIFLPWVNMWISEYRYGVWRLVEVRWFTIAWVFKLQTIFCEVTRELIIHAEMDEAGTLMIGGTLVPVEVIPDSLIRCIRESRERVISLLDTLALAEFEKYKSQMLAEKHMCKAHGIPDKNGRLQHPQKRSHCDNIALGAVLRCMLSAGIWPLPSSTSSRSVAKIAEALKSVENSGNEIVESTPRNSPQISHSSCGPQRSLKDGTSAILEELEALKLSDISPTAVILFPDGH